MDVFEVADDKTRDAKIQSVKYRQIQTVKLQSYKFVNNTS